MNLFYHITQFFIRIKMLTIANETKNVIMMRAIKILLSITYIVFILACIIVPLPNSTIII